MINREIIPGKKKRVRRMVCSINCDRCWHRDLAATECWPRWHEWIKYTWLAIDWSSTQYQSGLSQTAKPKTTHNWQKSAYLTSEKCSNNSMVKTEWHKQMLQISNHSEQSCAYFVICCNYNTMLHVVICWLSVNNRQLKLMTKLTGHVGVLRCGRQVEVTQQVENVSLDRHTGWRHRLWDWWWDGISTQKVKYFLTLCNTSTHQINGQSLELRFYVLPDTT